jgi:putative heme-binding domain-containing protein
MIEFSRLIVAFAFMFALFISDRNTIADDGYFVHPDWSATICAAEPQVIDPIAIRFDRHGRMWVVEMRDYPTGPKPDEKPRGRIRILRDKDGDGIYESATTFADELLFATGVQPWRNGAYVTLAGQIIYFEDTTKWTLDSIEQNKLAAPVVSPQVTSTLMEHSDPAIADQSRKLFAIDLNRQSVLDRYMPSISGQPWQQADLAAGRRRFEQSCSACHRIDELGVNVGPDISDTRDKSPASLLMSILHPSAAIDAAFYQYSVMTTDDKVIDGLLIDDRPSAVTIQRQGGERVVIPREDIDQLRASTNSLMPDGFERVIDEQGMANLIAYLKNWRYLKAGSKLLAK